jgi:hypothetical protein
MNILNLHDAAVCRTRSTRVAALLALLCGLLMMPAAGADEVAARLGRPLGVDVVVGPDIGVVHPRHNRIVSGAVLPQPTRVLLSARSSNQMLKFDGVDPPW